MEVDFQREKQWWNAKAEKEEREHSDELVNKELRWIEIERHLEGIKTILDVGAGTGAFSIPLAQRGFTLTHLDISSEMLRIARSKASGLSNIQFFEDTAVDLSRFEDRSFDLVLNMDGAISFCGSLAQRSIEESCRVTRKKLIITVSNKALMIPLWIRDSLRRLGHFSRADYEMLEHGEWHQNQFPENALFTTGMTENYLGALKAFLPDEIAGILEANGLKILRSGSIGSLAYLCGKDTIKKVRNDETVFKEFIKLCDRFDTEIMPNGPGTRQRAGLIAVAERSNAL